MKMNFTKLVFLIVMVEANFFTAYAQSPNWFWAKKIGGLSWDLGNSIAIDAFGNVYTTGILNGTVDFDPGPGTFNLTSPGNDNVFVSKLDALGNFVWAKGMGGPSGANGVSIALDAFGNVYTTGLFTGTMADFDPDLSAQFNLDADGVSDIFISKLDSSGNFVWAKRMGGTGDDRGLSITLDAFGNIYTMGAFQDTVDFDPGNGTFNLSSPGGDAIFISKLDGSGNFVWAKAIDGTIYNDRYSIAVDASCNVYITGKFSGINDFDPGGGVLNMSSIGGSDDIFIFKLDSSGNFVWAKSMGGSGDDKGISITLDASGNVYTTGFFTGIADFDPDSSAAFYLISAGYSDIFISKLDSSGNFVWAKAMGGIDTDLGNSIAVDVSGNLYVAGSFVGTADFDPALQVGFNLTSAGGEDIFIAQLDSSGNFVWVKTIGGIVNDLVESITVDTTGKLYITGSFHSPSITFGPGTLLNTDVTGHTSEIFIAKLGFDSWRPRQAMPQFVDYAAAFATGGYGYAGTGQDSLGGYRTNMYKFDPSGSGTWSTIASYSNAARARTTGFSLNGGGYIGLGYDGNSYNDFLEYFTSSDSWSTTSHTLNWNNGGAPNRYYSVAFTISNIAYVGTGTNGSTVYDDFYSFDGSNWTPIAPFPGGQRYAAVAFTIGDTAYVGTGMDGNGTAHQDFYAYDPVHGWHSSPINLGTGNERANAIAFAIGRFGFVGLGGNGNGMNCTNDLWQYDPSLNTFTQKTSLPSTSLYNYAVGFPINGKGYVCMGGNCDGTNPTNETWEYLPDNDITASVIGIDKINNYGNISRIFPNPVSDYATIRLNSKTVNLNSIHFSVNNLLGQTVPVENKLNKTPDGNITINIQRGKLRPGFYVYKILNGDQVLSTGKFIVD